MSSPTSTAITLADLPHEMLREIAGRLTYKSVAALALSCKTARDALTERPSLLLRFVKCKEDFLESAAVLRERADEVKVLSVHQATLRAAPALRRFTSLKMIVLFLQWSDLSIGEQLLTAAARASPRLATALLSFPAEEIGWIFDTYPGCPPKFVAVAPQVTRLKLIGKSSADGNPAVVCLSLGKWKTPALETLEFQGSIMPTLDLDKFRDSVILDELDAGEQDEMWESAASLQEEYSEENEEGSVLCREDAFDSLLTQKAEKRAQELAKAGQSVVRVPPRLRKVVVHGAGSRRLVPEPTRVLLSVLQASGVEVVYEKK